MDGLLKAFITLFVVMDPIGTLPLFASLTKGMPTAEIKKNINKSVFVAGILLFVFLFLGTRIFYFFNINLNSFRIAGGIILLIFGILFVFGISSKFMKPGGADLSVPIGTPLLTGPGVITTIAILVTENDIYIAIIAALLTLLSTWIILINFAKLYRFLGEHWTNIISRVMGIILAAMAVEFIKNGILDIIRPF